MSRPIPYHLGGFPPSNIDWTQLVPLIGRANAALARYDGIMAAMPNAAVLLSPLTTQEAVLSSKIEGTNVTMGEVLEIEAGADGDISQPKRDDAEEIRNYRQALTFAAKAVADRPLSLHLLRETHALLMDGVRGRDKSPGAFRSEQNWIGHAGCPVEQASFIPIPQAHLSGGLETRENYVASDRDLDPLVQLSVVHAEFEALHPFKDGNGRLGRMIIPLFLFQRRVLSGPNFYMSAYLEQRREEYIERLRAISRDGDWTGWCTFFLFGLFDQATENQSKAQRIIYLHQDMQHKIAEQTRSQFSTLAADFIFSRPIFSSSHFIESSQIPRESAVRIMRVLRDEGVLKVIREGAGRRPAIYGFPDLVNIAEGRQVL